MVRQSLGPATRFLLAHVAPFLFVLSYFFTRPPFQATPWSIAGARATPAHFHVLVSVMIATDLIFILWRRVLPTYKGF